MAFMISRLRRATALVVLIAGSALLTVACERVPLLAPTGSTITLTASTTALPANGSTDIIAQVIEAGGTPPHSGTAVTFTTNLGSIQPSEAETDVNGRVIVKFVAGNSNGTATITRDFGRGLGERHQRDQDRGRLRGRWSPRRQRQPDPHPGSWRLVPDFGEDLRHQRQRAGRRSGFIRHHRRLTRLGPRDYRCLGHGNDDASHVFDGDSHSDRWGHFVGHHAAGDRSLRRPAQPRAP